MMLSPSLYEHAFIKDYHLRKYPNTYLSSCISDSASDSATVRSEVDAFSSMRDVDDVARSLTSRE
jgi:hypothetical protein